MKKLLLSLNTWLTRNKKKDRNATSRCGFFIYFFLRGELNKSRKFLWGKIILLIIHIYITIQSTPVIKLNSLLQNPTEIGEKWSSLYFTPSHLEEDLKHICNT